MYTIVFAAIPLALALGVGWVLLRNSLLQPEALAYPVLLVNEETIAEVCLDVGELTLRPENQDYVIEQRFHIVDSTGSRFGIENYRVAEKKPSTLSRVFKATVFHVNSFRVAFELRPNGRLSREEVIAQLRDRDWTMPDSLATAPLAELFVAYRADRWREYGNARDRMPSEAEPAP